MRFKHHLKYFIFTFAFWAGSGFIHAQSIQEPAGSGGPQASSVFNPNISVIGWNETLTIQANDFLTVKSAPFVAVGQIEPSARTLFWSTLFALALSVYFGLMLAYEYARFRASRRFVTGWELRRGRQF